MAPSKKASVGIVFVGMMLTKYHDMMITMLPKPLDAMALRMYYPDMETRMNTLTAGEVELPHITYGLPMDPLKEGETLDKIFNPRGYPTLLKGAFVKDQDEVVAFLPYYAGFEAITDTEDVEKVLGIKSDQMGGRDYKMNNLFVKHVHVIKQEPGDAIYFGPNWCHSVWTDAGPNVMFNLRYQSPKLLKGGPKYLFFKALFRGIKHGFKFGKNPQDNRVIFGDIYEYLNHYFTECGPHSRAMEWSHLELRKASNLRKEVDEALRRFTSALEDDDPSDVEPMKRCFEARIEELEEFYLEHEDDERSILFEKQRMRLRRALAAAAPPPAASPARRAAAAARASGAAVPKSTVRSSVGFTPGYAAGQGAAPSTGRPTPAPSAAKAPAKPAATPKPLYAWEVVLSDAEYEELGALRRAAAAKKKKEARLDVKNKREPYINSALPYVDARRVEAAIYRPASKDGARWNY
ncbi:hypothetical protein JL722_12186 [Aureococcus anophagefferens]|nr:hypothetical protein JL722_12186 [Aureococcus anophagefferens]